MNNLQQIFLTHVEIVQINKLEALPDKPKNFSVFFPNLLPLSQAHSMEKQGIPSHWYQWFSTNLRQKMPVTYRQTCSSTARIETPDGKWHNKTQQVTVVVPTSHGAEERPGEWRPCGDYHQLNQMTKTDRYPIPDIGDISTKLHDKSMYSKIDLIKAFNQIPKNPLEVEKTAVDTPFGLFEWLYMPFSLSNAIATLQRYLNNIFMDIDCILIYIDNMLVYSEDEEQHKKDLSKVLWKLQENDLRVAIHKSEFFLKDIDFLGNTMSKEEIKPCSSRLDVIKNFPKPNLTRSLRTFPGCVNHYRHLIPQIADIVLSLTDWQTEPEHQFDILFWGEAAFAKIQEILSSAIVFLHPVPGITHLHLVADSS